MAVEPEDPRGINLYALVKYLPDPLGAFLTALRTELVPSCHLRSHLTVLPPRQVQSRDGAWQRLRDLTPTQRALHVVLGEIEIFPVTSVIYLSIASGFDELVCLHRHLAQESLAFDEPFVYHPHVTIAQGLDPEAAIAAAAVARRRWREYTGPRSFNLDVMTFVQSTDAADWLDLGEFGLDGGPPPAQ